MIYSIVLLCSSVLFVKAGPLSLLAIGDWGGESDSKPTNSAQIAAANGMSEINKKRQAEGILLLGDNFYTHGVSSNMSVRFKETFEDVYTEEKFGSELPFYVIAGNHDHYGDVSAEVAYHDNSSRWHFPSLYYKLPFNFTSSTGVSRTVDIMMIDTVVLAGMCEYELNARGSDLEVTTTTEEEEEEEECNLTMLDEYIEESKTQWEWLESELESSNADFLWVAGHYPIYSAGGDGTTEALVKQLLPLLKKHNAHYISGHDHMHEHVEVDGVNMFVTGPGRMCCYDTPKWNTIPKDAMKFMVSGNLGHGKSVGRKVEGDMHSGFSLLTFDDSVQVTMYKEDGTPVWEPAPIAPRSARYTQK